MKPNLDILKPEIELYLEETGLAVFYGYPRPLEPLRRSIGIATSIRTIGCSFNPRGRPARSSSSFISASFSPSRSTTRIEKLHACELPPQESRQFEERLNDLRAYEGSVCAIELSFDHEGRVFLFDLRTEWFDEFSEMQDEIQLLVPDPDDDGR